MSGALVTFPHAERSDRDMPCVMTALGELAPEFLVVSGNSTRIDRIRGGAIAEDLQVADRHNVPFERQ